MNPPYIRHLWNIGPFRVFLVNGEYIRDNIQDDFALGSNHMADPEFVPKHEIFIEDTTHETERIFIAIHEIFEHKAMEWGLPYELAHKISNVVEIAARKHPDAVTEILSVI